MLGLEGLANVLNDARPCQFYNGMWHNKNDRFHGTEAEFQVARDTWLSVVEHIVDEMFDDTYTKKYVHEHAKKTFVLNCYKKGD